MSGSARRGSGIGEFRGCERQRSSFDRIRAAGNGVLEIRNAGPSLEQFGRHHRLVKGRRGCRGGGRTGRAARCAGRTHGLEHERNFRATSRSEEERHYLMSLRNHYRDGSSFHFPSSRFIRNVTRRFESSVDSTTIRAVWSFTRAALISFTLSKSPTSSGPFP